MKLDKLIKETFALSDDVEIKDDSGPGSLPGWDSVGHVDLINNLEESFNITISNEEIMQIKNITDIKNILRKKGFTDI